MKNRNMTRFDAILFAVMCLAILAMAGFTSAAHAANYGINDALMDNPDGFSPIATGIVIGALIVGWLWNQDDMEKSHKNRDKMWD